MPTDFQPTDVRLELIDKTMTKRSSINVRYWRVCFRDKRAVRARPGHFNGFLSWRITDRRHTVYYYCSDDTHATDMPSETLWPPRNYVNTEWQILKDGNVWSGFVFFSPSNKSISIWYEFFFLYITSSVMSSTIRFKMFYWNNGSWLFFYLKSMKKSSNDVSAVYTIPI